MAENIDDADVPREVTKASLSNLINSLHQDEIHLMISKMNISYEELFELLNDERPLTEFAAYRLHQIMLLYIPPLLILVGTIGNILSFIVFFKNMRKVSTYTYLCSLAFMDLLVLYIGLARLWVAQFDNIDIKDKVGWACKIVMFLGYMCSDSSVWIIVAMTVERYIVVLHPLRARRYCSIRKSRFTVLLPILVSCAVNSHFFWTVELRPITGNITEFSCCDASPPFHALVNEFWPWMDAIIYSFLPFTILTILNGKILKEVYSAKVQRRTYTTDKSVLQTTLSHASWSVSKKLTKMLLLVSSTFLLTTLPVCIMLIMTTSWNRQSQEQKAYFYLAKTVAELLMYLNHTINFFLYCLSGMKFRRELLSCLPGIANHQKDKSYEIQFKLKEKEYDPCVHN